MRGGGTPLPLDLDLPAAGLLFCFVKHNFFPTASVRHLIVNAIWYLLLSKVVAGLPSELYNNDEVPLHLVGLSDTRWNCRANSLRRLSNEKVLQAVIATIDHVSSTIPMGQCVELLLG